MRFMVIVKASKESEQGVLPTEQDFAEMNAFNEKLVKAGVFLEGDPRLVEDREPIELDPLDQHQLGMLLLDQAVKDASDTSLQAFVEATGVLPDGTVGALVYRDTWRAVRHIADRARPWAVGPRKKPLPVSVNVPPATCRNAQS